MKKATESHQTKSAPMFIQMSIYTAILLVSQIISELLPKALPIPATVIGLILMYALLSSHLIKVEWVDSLGSLLISMIGFMFVPSGISIAANLNILQAEGLQLILVIGLSTVAMLVIVTYVTRVILSLRQVSLAKLAEKLHFHTLKKFAKEVEGK
ncbi:CidA/LrgA family protein [Streptococcus dentasini]